MRPIKSKDEECIVLFLQSGRPDDVAEATVSNNSITLGRHDSVGTWDGQKGKARIEKNDTAND